VVLAVVRGRHGVFSSRPDEFEEGRIAGRHTASRSHHGRHPAADNSIGLAWNQAVFAGFLVSLSSTAIVLKTMRIERRWTAPTARNLVHPDISGYRHRTYDDLHATARRDGVTWLSRFSSWL